MCPGSLIARDFSSIARPMACLIHHVAYVLKRYPRRQSYFCTARMSPMLPSWIRSSKGRPRPI